MHLDRWKLRSGELAQLACLLESTARKPGNVHRFRDFDDAHYLDFLLSATAIAGPMGDAPTTTVGRTVLRSVEATRRRVRSNTNLGMVLLLAPMATVPLSRALREGVEEVVAATTREDAALVYRAIRLARPGGLGQSEDQDVAEEPTVTLRDAMRLAADRDLVARQYATGYVDVFDHALPTLRASIEQGRPLETSIIFAYLTFLAHRPDTLIARKRGESTALEATDRAAGVLDSGWPDTPSGIEALGEFDDWLRLDGHARNPGATADLITAALFASLRDGTIKVPIAGSW